MKEHARGFFGRSASVRATCPCPTPVATRRAILLTVAVAGAAFFDPQAAWAQWDRPIDWLIPCTAVIEAAFGPTHPLCDDLHSEASIKQTLDEASRLLESLGFESPAVGADLDLANHMSEAVAAEQLRHQREPRCEDHYCAWLVYDLKAHGSYSRKGRSLVLDPFRHTADGKLEPGYDDGFGYAEIHELFHAVQFGYPGVDAAHDDWVEWIIEGTAEHATLAVGRQMGFSAGGAVWFRTYDQPLHVPPTEDDEDPAFKDWQYGSWEFFDFLGDYLGSDLGIQYLDHLFRTLDVDQNNGLQAVEAAAHHEPGYGKWKGLYEAFPEFVAQRLSSPCYFSHLGTWKGGDCAQGEDNEHRFELAFPDTVRRLEHQARDMSANGYLVRLEVPEGKEGLLTIRVPPDRDEEYLHLIVDDERRDVPGAPGRRNEYTTIVSPGPHEFFVRLANVPWQISEVDGGEFDFATAPVEFMLVEPYATVTSISTSPGPSGADVDRPLEIRFDQGLEAMVMDIIPESYPGIPTGLEQPCGLSTRPTGMRRGDPISGEMLVFGMWHEGPIGPGEYPIHPHPEPETARPIGSVGVGFTLGLGNPMTDRPTQSYYGTAGVLTIESVSGGFVRGELEVVGENILAVDARHHGWDLAPCSAINPDPCIFEGYIANAVIRVEFGLPARSFSFPNRDAVAACLSPSKPNPGKANPGPGPGPGDPEPKPDPDPGGDPRDDPVDGLPIGADPEAQPKPGEPVGDPAAGDRGGDAAMGIGPSLVLDFLEEERADLHADPQNVRGSAAAHRIALESGAFTFRMAFDGAEVDSCDLSQDARGLLRMLGSGRLLRGGLHLEADAGTIELRMTFDEGDIVVRASDPGSMRLTGSGPVVRGDVSGGDLAIEREAESASCEGIVDFSFRLTEAR